MTATTVAIDIHIQELIKVATDLRNERTLASPARTVANRIRLAIGETLSGLGTAFAADTRQPMAQAR